MSEQVPTYRVKLHREKLHSEVSTSNEAIVFIHGMEDRWQTWRALGQQFSSDYQVYYLEVPWSGIQGHYWAKEKNAQQWLKEGIEDISDMPKHLIGHSFGASAILEYLCEQHRPQVKSATLLSPFYRRDTGDFHWDCVAKALASTCFVLREGLETRYEKHRLPDKETLDIMGEKVRDRLGPYGFTEFFHTYLHSAYLNLENLSQLTSVITGALDPSSEGRYTLDLAEDLAHAEAFILDGVGHYPVIDKPEIVRDIIKSMLEKVQADGLRTPTYSSQPQALVS